MDRKTPIFSNHGCRLNAYETEAMKELAQNAGLGDAVIVNTCAVTAEAVRKARQDIRRLRRENPTARLIVTGCAAQVDPDRFAAMDEVDHVIGNTEKMAPATWGALSTGATEPVQVNDIMSVTETAGHLIDGFDTRSRAYVQVQNGCDHRCTFCIIPFGARQLALCSCRCGGRSDQAAGGSRLQRGRADRRRPDILGADLPATPHLGDLVLRILKLVPDLPRLRISSIDSIEADPALMQAIATEPRLMPHLHLSLQHGDTLILKRMKRRHSRDDAVAFCEEARRLRPDMTYGADIIAGFPTETEDHFAQSLALVRDCDLTWLHVFPYSPREGTPAARMPAVDGPTIKSRAARLRAEGTAAVARHLKSEVGHLREVLMESPTMGRTPGFAEVHFTTPRPTGEIVQTRITGAADTHLTA